MRLFGSVKSAETVNCNYISIKIKGRKQQDTKTAANAVRFRINQEIKFQYKGKQHFNEQLYRAHLKCAHHYYGTWQHIQTLIDRQLKQIMENQYQNLNKKLDTLIKRSTFKYFYCI